jgi:2-dehydropantoate 2-reductase
MADERIAIFGAGLIGCYIGGLLAAAGRRVTFLARPRIVGELSANGLTLTDYAGLNIALPAGYLDLQMNPGCLAGADVILLTVKSRGTAEAADSILTHGAGDALVVSLQNGVDNVSLLAERLGRHRVLGAMVPFNVVGKGAGRFRRATSGDLVLQAGRADIVRLLSVPHLKVSATDNIEGVLWGKLIVNLNNALNALSNLPLKTQLEQHAWRSLLADQIAEALAVLDAAGITPVPAVKLPPRLLPTLLRLPDFLFKPLARSMLKIDPESRSSMWDDLVQRRPTEIDYLQGAILRLAPRTGVQVPLTARIVSLVKEAERQAAGPPGLTPAQVASPQRGVAGVPASP